MNNYSIRIEVPEGELSKILNKLNKAQETIYECYQELERLGVVKLVKEKDASGN